MRLIPSMLALCSTLALCLTPAHAHEDQRLKAWLDSQPAATTSHYEHAQAYAQLGNLWKELGDGARSQALFARSREATARVQDAYVRDVLAGHLANELASGQQYDEALRALDQVKDSDVWVKTAWKLIGKLSKSGHAARAAELLQRTEVRTRSVTDLLQRAELLSGTGAAYRYVDKARGENLVYESYGMAQMLADPYERAIMLNEAGAHLVDIGHRERAMNVFDDVDRLVPQIRNPLHQAQALAMLGGEQAEKNMRDRAALALDKGRKIAQGLADGEDRSAVLSEIARNYGQSHKFEPGIAVAEGIADPYHRIEGFIRIAKNMSRTGKKDGALVLQARSEKEAAAIRSPFLRATVLRKLASERLDARQHEEAKALLLQAESAISGPAA